MIWKVTWRPIVLFMFFFSLTFGSIAAPFGGNSVAAASGIFNVKDFGAKGDGIADDSKAIRLAVSEAGKAGGGTVVFGKGVFIIKGFVDVPDHVSITGQGMTATTLKRTDKKDERILSLKGNQVVQSIGFNSKIGILPLGDNITIKGVKFTCRTQGIQMAMTVSNLKVLDSLFDGSGYGILSNQKPSYDVVISNTTFRNNTADDIEINAPSERWLIENCVFQNNLHTTSGAGFGVGVSRGAADITISGSSFTNIVGQGIHLENRAQAVIKNSTFKNNGSAKYKGSPKADIAVLSNASAKIADCTFLASDAGFSTLAIHSATGANPGSVVLIASKFYQKSLMMNLATALNSFIPVAN